MTELPFQLDTVFGVSRAVPLNYVSRDNVDAVLVNYLDRKRHIVIHGGSKQGKTCLRKHCLGDECIVLQCSHLWDLPDIHAQILKQAGYQAQESTTIQSRQGGSVKIKARLPVGARFEAGGEASRERTETFTALELDLQSPNDIISALKAVKFSSYIVLEDFHYLKESTQADLAIALKAYHEQSDYCFVIVGVWFDDDRITAYNSDLTGRIVAVNADAWSQDELRSVAECGADLLNIEFDDRFLTELIDASFGSVAVVQEACAELCRMYGVTQTQPDLLILGGGTDARGVIAKIVASHGARYKDFLRQFGTGKGSGGSAFGLHRWILYPLVTRPARELEAGITLADLTTAILSRHPEGHYVSDRPILKALQQAAEIQAKCKISPPVIAWDSAREVLSVTDRGFLIWLDSQSTPDLLGFSGLSGWA